MYIIEIPYMDLDQIYNSGQTFRWLKIREKKYIIPFKDKAVKVEQNKQRFIFDCSEEDFLNVWWPYFDIGTDYSVLYYNIKKTDELTKIMANRASGIHMLKQDFFEVLITSLLKLKLPKYYGVYNVLDTIARKTGVKHVQSMREAGKVTWFEFPDASKLIKKQCCISDSEVGGLKQQILDLCDLINEGWIDQSLLNILSVDDAKSYLMDFVDDSELVDFLLMYSAGCKSLFVYDESVNGWIDKHGLNKEGFESWYFEDNEELKNISALLMHYIKYNFENPPIRIEEWMQK